MMDKLIKIYLELERRVSVIRADQSDDSVEEDTYLAVMDLLWWEMSEEQRQTLERRSLEKKGTGSL